MDMMNSIATMAMSLSAAKFQQDYSISVAKKAMDTQELAVQEILKTLPQTSNPVSSAHFDVYA